MKTEHSAYALFSRLAVNNNIILNPYVYLARCEDLFVESLPETRSDQ